MTILNKLFPFLVLLVGCTQKPIDLSEQARQEIIQADLEMSDLAVKEGFHKTLLAFADDSLVKPEEGKFPVMGKKALEENWEDKDDIKTLTWVPYKAEASRSGEMGYTLGNWKFVGTDTTYYGNYYTTWKKYPDGKWKWVVDGGNNTPEPKK